MDGLRDIYDAEKQLVKSAAEDDEGAFKQRTQRIVQRASGSDEKSGHARRAVPGTARRKGEGQALQSDEGSVEEAQEHLQEHEKGELLDQVLVGPAQKVEHYEIAAYGTARAIAKSLGNKEALNLLQETLREEEGQDKQLSVIAIRLQKEMGRAKPDNGRRGSRAAAARGATAGRRTEQSRRQQKKK